MKKEIAQLWSRALRSNEWKQGKHALEVNGKVCPLGLLCQLAMVYGHVEFEPYKGIAGKYGGKLAEIPDEVKEWAEMYGNNGEIKGDFLTIVGYNDFMDYTFNEIAEVIDENWSRL
jgi:hypothetical protein